MTPAAGSFPRWYLAMLPGLGRVVRCHLPGAPVDRRRRELVAEAVSGAAGADALARLHAAWHDVLGPAELSEIDDEVLAWAVATASGEGAHADLPDEVDPRARAALGALVAHGVVAALTVERASSLVDRVRGRRRADPLAALGDLAACALGAPVTVPAVVVGAALGTVGRLAPPAAPVEVVGEPNLMSQLLAETVPTWLGSAWGRTLVARLPVSVPVSVRSGATAATVRIGRGRVQVHDGVAVDAWALLDGEVDALVRAASRSVTRELRAARLGR